ncbi:TetR/AcrR family transcriptional regulator [Serratia ficaria]|uniref:TetR/AcrR family transcriptional regulator n=1 Tax=Serratia TaxID=613 RepID=UPI001013C864|nr:MULTISPECIES: TetR/AcrR family transcriptional regulator [Serratia]MEE4483758.1 TetR/AcrR family transcriptional regulator [Serratia ficaria]CAI0832413.1 HTH-type transcriptional repressor Bm3R1 [Serratia ficaria]CAI0871279.1 HTH-type transcriptional repressor Bm3R1 [Serratia ficaria]CAI0878003.1 HTH-type transcriptional repressor Bm3R1 [Serratia ficaria]CAI1525664.1 HTH-type transcriptional repressor Bm3R1 [Serratia ficaria]
MNDKQKNILPLRRKPSQTRSREKVKLILDCATELIARQGSDAMRMSEVAQKAGISIGALYQYFPDKTAIVRVLAQRYNQEARECIEQGLAQADSLPRLVDAFNGLIDEYYALFMAEPVMRDIWAATQTSQALREEEVAESRLNGALLAAAIARLRPQAERTAIEQSAFLLMHLGEATMRLAVSTGPQEGRALVDGYKRMAAKVLTDA